MAQSHHYPIQIQRLAVHYVHEPSPYTDAIPIVLLHGWPFYKIHNYLVWRLMGEFVNFDFL